MENKSIRDRHVKVVSDNTVQPLTTPEIDELEAYEAFGAGPVGTDTETGIMLHYGDVEVDAREVIFYSNILRVIGTNDTHVNIISSEGIYIIAGEHIAQLLNDIQDKKVHFIQAFKPDKHAEPDPDAPIIASIEYLASEDYWARVREAQAIRPSAE